MEHTLSGKQQMMTDVSSDVSGSLTWLELLSEGRLSVSELLDIESRYNCRINVSLSKQCNLTQRLTGGREAVTLLYAYEKC